MKPFSKISVLLLLISFSYSCAVQQQQPVYTQQESVNFQVFYDELSPYGQWVDYPNYGYVWLPDVRRNFSPYSTDGYWVDTEYGWTWVSDYQWGWAPFHYGRWDYDDFYGWFWVPDNEWGPSWVTWRSGNGYYGWAPMRPGMSIDMSYNDGYRDSYRWNFVRDRDFGRTDIHRYYIDRREYTTIINNSRVIDRTTVDRRRNTTYVAGPTRENVQGVTGRRINRVAVQDTERPGQRLNSDQLSIYRPQVKPTDNRGQRPAPSRVAKLEEVKSARERNATNPRNNVTPFEDKIREQKRQPGEQIHRRRQEIQSQPQTQQPQVTPAQQPQQIDRQEQLQRRRQAREEVKQQQQTEREQQQIQKSQPVQPQVTTPEQPQQMEKKPQQRRRQDQQR